MGLSVEGGRPHSNAAAPSTVSRQRVGLDENKTGPRPPNQTAVHSLSSGDCDLREIDALFFELFNNPLLDALGVTEF